MKAIMIMFDSLNKRFLESYGCDTTYTKNFKRLSEQCVTFNNAFVGSMPCMPARRELHTGRYNFLHRSWGAMEPFDESMPEILNDNGIRSHLITDHYHYFEDGGMSYNTRYSSWEFFRGQEGDPWKAKIDYIDFPENHKNGRWGCSTQDFVNRSYLTTPDKQPQGQTFLAGIDFINENHNKNNWFLQIETFDPHEPFFSHKQYKDLYPHGYDGNFFDWPPYAMVKESNEEITHLQNEYFALLSMCDDYLGKVLDVMDENNMWQDTMLIVNTDHGFSLGEHDFWAKCYFPFYNEVANTPLFVYNPQLKIKNTYVDSVVQTIDIAPTILEYFNLPIPKTMLGKSLNSVISDDKPIHENNAILFGSFAGQINCTDGEHVYMLSPKNTDDPLYQYTMSFTRHNYGKGFMPLEELQTMTQVKGFDFTKGLDVLRLEYKTINTQANYETMLFNINDDPKQLNPIKDDVVESRMLGYIKKLMLENDAPKELYSRFAL